MKVRLNGMDTLSSRKVYVGLNQLGERLLILQREWIHGKELIDIFKGLYKYFIDGKTKRLD